MNIIFPMLGEGSRFKKEGYDIPKYLLKLAEENILYFVLYGFRFFKENNFVFLVRKDHKRFKPSSEIERVCEQLGIQKFNIILINELTAGQADSVRLAFPCCEKNKPLLIFNIDTIHLGLNPNYSFKEKGMLESFEAKGDHWSFVEIDENNHVKQVTEKIRISKNCSNGLYYFKSIQLFKDAYFDLYKNDNSQLKTLALKEAYIAPMYNYFIKNGMKVLNRPVKKDLILASGIPKEYKILNSKYKFKKQLEEKFEDIL